VFGVVMRRAAVRFPLCPIPFMKILTVTLFSFFCGAQVQVLNTENLE
jgi:hypothetical protein